MRCAIALPLFLVLGLTVASTPGAAASGPGLIAYSSDYSPLLNDHLFSYAPGHGRPTMLGVGFDPAWSPDGRRVAFLRGDTPHVQVFVMNANGSGLAQVTHATGTSDDSISNDVRPVWSPDGTTIEYMEYGPVTKLLNVATGDTTSLATATLRWAPDGRHIAYLASQGSEGPSIVVSAPDGSAPVTVASGSSQPVFAWSPDSSRIAYAYGSSSLSVVGADGTGTLALTTGRTSVWCPSWSPDSTRVTFWSSPGSKLFVARSDGTGSTRLATHREADSCPSWSPDGHDVAFLIPNPHDQYQDTLYVLKVSNGRERALVRFRINSAVVAATPAWSPNGRKLSVPVSDARILVVPSSGGRTTISDWGRRAPHWYFTPGYLSTGGLPTQRPGANTFLFSAHIRPADQEIFVMAADGSNPRALTSNSYDDEYPSWSPDGRRLVFARSGHGVDGIWVMDSDGTHARRLTSEQGDSTPEWSPDGRSIAYVSGAGLWVIGVDGSAQRRLVASNVFPGLVSWSPDGTQIAYANGSIHVVDADGSHDRQLTSGAQDWSPAWSPDGSTIVFAAYRDPDPKLLRDSNAFGLFTVHPDGTGLQKILTYRASHPSWSPDGRQIVFQSFGWIYSMNADGTGVTQLVGGPDLNQQPAWSSS